MFSWIPDGVGVIGLGRDISACFQLYAEIHSPEPHPFFNRAFLNVESGLLRRDTKAEIYGRWYKKTTRRNRDSAAAGEIATLPSKFRRGGRLHRKTPLKIPNGSTPLTMVEWGVAIHGDQFVEANGATRLDYGAA